MNYRDGTPADAPALSRLILSFVSLLAASPDGEDMGKFLASVSIEAEQEYLSSSRYAYLLAEDDDVLAGFVAVRDCSHLFHLFVAPQFQRLGLASELWQRARQRAMQAGNPDGRFTVNSSVNAVPVYQRFGFVISEPPKQSDGVRFVPMLLPGAGPGERP